VVAHGIQHREQEEREERCDKDVPDRAPFDQGEDEEKDDEQRQGQEVPVPEGRGDELLRDGPFLL
jgi:hypothetical protein